MGICLGVASATKKVRAYLLAKHACATSVQQRKGQRGSNGHPVPDAVRIKARESVCCGCEAVAWPSLGGGLTVWGHEVEWQHKKTRTQEPCKTRISTNSQRSMSRHHALTRSLAMYSCIHAARMQCVFVAVQLLYHCNCRWDYTRLVSGIVLQKLGVSARRAAAVTGTRDGGEA